MEEEEEEDDDDDDDDDDDVWTVQVFFVGIGQESGDGLIYAEMNRSIRRIMLSYKGTVAFIWFINFIASQQEGQALRLFVYSFRVFVIALVC